MKWWEIQGVPKPIYVGIKEKRSSLSFLLFIIGAFILFLLQLLDVLFRELTFILITLLLLTQGIQTFFTGFYKVLTHSTIGFIKQLLTTLNGLILVWSVPSKYVPVAAKVVGGAYIYVFGYKGEVYIVYGYPIVHGKIEKPRKRLQVLRITDYMGIVEKIVINGKEHRVKRIEVVAPYPEIPRIWYRMIIRGFMFKSSETQPSIIKDIIVNKQKIKH